MTEQAKQKTLLGSFGSAALQMVAATITLGLPTFVGAIVGLFVMGADAVDGGGSLAHSPAAILLLPFIAFLGLVGAAFGAFAGAFVGCGFGGLLLALYQLALMLFKRSAERFGHPRAMILYAYVLCAAFIFSHPAPAGHHQAWWAVACEWLALSWLVSIVPALIAFAVRAAMRITATPAPQPAPQANIG